MLTHKERMLAVMRGEMVDLVPFVPRLDLWWLANRFAGTLPERHKDRKPDEIARAEGWACYHMVPDFVNMMSGPEDILHRSIGLFSLKQSIYSWRFSDDVEVKVRDEKGQKIVEYHTPLGMVRTVGGLTEEMQRAGASLGWTQEHIIKGPDDYRAVAHIFQNLEVFPQYEGAQAYSDEVGDCGVVAVGGPSLGASPMHHIQKEFLDPTQFFFEYQDNYGLMRELAESVEVYFDKVLDIIEGSPAEVVLWGANYDDMLTYPPYFEKEILPWIRKASERLGARGKIVATHTDGENQGLMDLIHGCGAHVAESVTPYPMTKLTIQEYYARWRDKITIMGGIPECITLRETASDEEFEAFLDDLFTSVSPGDRLILGIADSTPPNAVFDRLLRIGERVQTEGRLPLTGGGVRPRSVQRPDKVSQAVSPKQPSELEFGSVQESVIAGDADGLKTRVRILLDQGVAADQILRRGMIAAMETIGEGFTRGEVFIPEILLSARAMNEALLVLEPFLSQGAENLHHKVLIGTVRGDLHDIGKNMVATMLRGVGFEVRDLGINVARDEFVRQVDAYDPDVVAMSALLTTTMQEMKEVVEALEQAGVRSRVKILVGGAPLNQRFAEEIGADGYAAEAGSAVSVARRLVQ
jgi:methylmalonyl-CoA mutase cobalamin-binding domain/chain